MRYVRSFIILFILLFFLTDIGSVYAVDSLFSVSGCDDITKPCQTTGDGVNTVIPLSQTVSKIAATAAQLIGDNLITKWAGQLKPLGSYLIGKQKLNDFATQVQTASDTDLNPAQLQAVEQHDETPKSFSMTSRECVYDPQTNKLIGNYISKNTVITDDIPWIRPSVEGSRRLSSFTTGYVQESQDYRLPNITIRQDAALPCESQLSGDEPKRQNSTAFQFDNTYAGPIGNVAAQIFYTITAAIIKPFTNSKGGTNAEASVTIPAKIVGTGQSPFAGHSAALSAGCAESSDLDAVSYATDEQKKKLCEAGGFVNSMYRPDAIDPTYTSNLNASDTKQKWNQTIIGETTTAPNNNAFAARIEAAGDYTNCTLMPADYQSTAVPGGECNNNWVGAAPGSTTAGGWNCKTDTGEQSVTGLHADGGQRYADTVWGFCASGTQNAWKLCKDDVIARAKKACVNPLFALAIWLHESGASNYICGQQLSGGKVQDFGINVSDIAENFSQQLDRFLQLPGGYAAKCPTKTLRDFVAMYWFGKGCYNTQSSGNKTKIDGYIGELQLIYSTIAPGVSLPTWPGGC